MKTHLTPDIYVFDYRSFLIRVAVAAALVVIVYSTFFGGAWWRNLSAAPATPSAAAGFYPTLRGAVMNDYNHREDSKARELGIWENEGGAPNHGDMSHHYGRRVEPDKSWTIYHVFSGAPAELEGRPMAGLGETEATSTMIFLNARNARRRRASSLRQTFATRF